MLEGTERRSAIPAFLLIGIAVLIIMNIVSHRRIANLEMQLNNMHSSFHMQLGDVRNTTSNTMWDMSRRLDELSEQARPSFGEIVLIQNYDIATAMADVEVAFSLRTHTPGDVVSITARGQDGQTHSAVASPQEAGRFTASMNLPLRGNYVFTFTTAGETITTGELAQLNLADRLCGRFSYWLGHSQSSGTNQPTLVTLHPYFRNNTEGNPALDVTSLSIIVERENGDVITTLDLTEYLHDTGHGQVLQMGWDFSLTVGDYPGVIRPDEFTMARLVIHDSLGIRYEQLDEIFFPGQFSFGRGGVHSITAWESQRAIAWASGDNTVSFGRIRIVE